MEVSGGLAGKKTTKEGFEDAFFGLVFDFVFCKIEEVGATAYIFFFAGAVVFDGKTIAWSVYTANTFNRVDKQSSHHLSNQN